MLQSQEKVICTGQGCGTQWTRPKIINTQTSSLKAVETKGQMRKTALPLTGYCAKLPGNDIPGFLY